MSLLGSLFLEFMLEAIVTGFREFRVSPKGLDFLHCFSWVYEAARVFDYCSKARESQGAVT